MTNGREFVNACLVGWCRHRGIRFTRGRPARMNDQAWVEQRNGLLVRRLVGYDRYSSRAAWTVLQRLYALLRLQHNFFRPVRKLLSKRRVGSKVLKRYDSAQTPYQRVLAAGGLSADQQQALTTQYQALDPITLARDIQRTLDVLWKLAETRSLREATARGNTIVRHRPRGPVTPASEASRSGAILPSRPWTPGASPSPSWAPTAWW